MVARPFLVPVLLVVSFAGCLDAADVQVEQRFDADAVLGLRGATAPPGEYLSWDGATLVYEETDQVAPRCGPRNCEVTPFTLDAPPGGWVGSHELRVALTWSHGGRLGDYDFAYPWFGMTVTTPSGDVHTAPWSRYAQLLVFPDPEAGAYVVEVRVFHEAGVWQPLPDGSGVWAEPPTPVRGSYQGHLRLDRAPELPEAPRELLPDLALTHIEEFRIEYGPPPQYGWTPITAPWTKGCGVDEFVERAATRCLRATVSIGNAGEGKLQLLFRGDSEEPQAVRQCLEATDGATRIVEAGRGAWHRTHTHHHHDDVVQFTLHAYDEATGGRGAVAAEGQKFGWGFYPLGLMLPEMLPQPTDAWLACGASETPEEDVAYGLGAGWYDAYLWWRNGNYVDIAGVPDGLYEFEVTLNPKGLIVERDVAPNVGTALLRITGDRVEVVRPFVAEYGRAEAA